MGPVYCCLIVKHFKVCKHSHTHCFPSFDIHKNLVRTVGERFCYPSTNEKTEVQRIEVTLEGPTAKQLQHLDVVVSFPIFFPFPLTLRLA